MMRALLTRAANASLVITPTTDSSPLPAYNIPTNALPQSPIQALIQPPTTTAMCNGVEINVQASANKRINEPRFSKQ